LDDRHERSEDVPFRNAKGKVEVKRERNTYQSEIELSKEDGERFLDLCSCKEFVAYSNGVTYTATETVPV